MLPKLGESNQFAYWQKLESHSRKGLWHCRICCDNATILKNSGLGGNGLISKIRRIYCNARYTAERENHAIPSSSPEEILEIWHKQNYTCISCGCSIDLRMKFSCCMDHDHKTGYVRGFVCRNCNLSEGCLKDFSKERLFKVVNYILKCRGENA